jgi:guanylate kinase
MKTPNKHNNGKLLIISGPSAGVGKDTILKMFLEKHPDWLCPPSMTTRTQRPGEISGIDYYFVNKKTFEKRMRNGDFLETDFHADHWYGTLRKPVEELLAAGEKVVLRKDVNGSIEIKKQIPEAIVVFLDAESPEVLESRIRSRSSETEEQIIARLELAKKEQELKKHFDHVVINPHNRAHEALATIEAAAGLN